MSAMIVFIQKDEGGQKHFHVIISDKDNSGQYLVSSIGRREQKDLTLWDAMKVAVQYHRTQMLLCGEIPTEVTSLTTYNSPTKAWVTTMNLERYVKL